MSKHNSGTGAVGEQVGKLVSEINTRGVPISKKARRPGMTEYHPSTRFQNVVAAVVGNGERCGIGCD